MMGRRAGRYLPAGLPGTGIIAGQAQVGIAIFGNYF